MSPHAAQLKSCHNNVLKNFVQCAQELCALCKNFVQAAARCVELLALPSEVLCDSGNGRTRGRRVVQLLQRRADGQPVAQAMAGHAGQRRRQLSERQRVSRAVEQ